MPKKRQMQAAALRIKIDMNRRELVQVACPDYAHENHRIWSKNVEIPVELFPRKAPGCPNFYNKKMLQTSSGTKPRTNKEHVGL